MVPGVDGGLVEGTGEGYLPIVFHLSLLINV